MGFNDDWEFMKALYLAMKRFVRGSPLVYFGLFGWRKSVRRLRAHKDFDLVVEAYPRSANTSSMYALFYAQGNDFKVGHHLHVPAHVKYAVSRKIPCLVILRNPIDCVASLMVGRNGGDPSALLKHYVDFVATVDRCGNRVVVAAFDDIVKSGLGFAVNGVNERFGCSFSVPSGSLEEKAWVEQRITEWNNVHCGGDLNRISIPNETKRRRSEEMKLRIRSEAPEELSAAEAIFFSLARSCVRP